MATDSKGTEMNSQETAMDYENTAMDSKNTEIDSKRAAMDSNNPATDSKSREWPNFTKNEVLIRQGEDVSKLAPTSARRGQTSQRSVDF